MFDFLACVLISVAILLIWSLGNIMLTNFKWMQKMMTPIHVSLRAILEYIVFQLKRFWCFLKSLLHRGKGTILQFSQKEIENLSTQLEMIILEAK